MENISSEVRARGMKNVRKSGPIRKSATDYYIFINKRRGVNGPCICKAIGFISLAYVCGGDRSFQRGTTFNLADLWRLRKLYQDPTTSATYYRMRRFWIYNDVYSRQVTSLSLRIFERIRYPAIARDNRRETIFVFTRCLHLSVLQIARTCHAYEHYIKRGCRFARGTLLVCSRLPALLERVASTCLYESIAKCSWDIWVMYIYCLPL